MSGTRKVTFISIRYSINSQPLSLIHPINTSSTKNGSRNKPLLVRLSRSSANYQVFGGVEALGTVGRAKRGKKDKKKKKKGAITKNWAQDRGSWRGHEA